MTVVATRRGVSVVAIAPVLPVRSPLVVRISARMAVNAGERRVVRRNQVAIRTDRAIMRYAEPGVIKGRAQPTRGDPGDVAGQASGRVQRGNVVRHGAAERHGALPSGLVAAVAIRVRHRESVVVPNVAVSAGRDFAGRRHLVRARQRPARGAVIKGCGGPGNGAVASRAVRGGKWGAG